MNPMQSPNTGVGKKLSAAPGKLDCLVRQCLGCGNITAADIENTPQLRREMHRDGQVVREVTHDECMKLWKGAKHCECK